MRGYHHWPLDREPTMDEVYACQFIFQPGLTEEDRNWIRRHLQMAGVDTPVVDVGFLREKHMTLKMMSWLTTNEIRTMYLE